MNLSLMVHANRNRADRVQCLLTRLTLNKQIHSSIDFEVILFDGGSTDNTKDLCMHFAKYMDLKYVYSPLKGPTNESYPISIMKGMCRGDHIGFVSADHWISENLVSHMTFLDGATFWTGKVARSEDSKVHDDPASMVDALLDDRCSCKGIESILELCDISPTEGSNDLWSYRVGTDDETYGGGRIEGPRVVAIDMWRPPQDFIEPGCEKGKLLEYSYAVISDQTLEEDELRCYIEQRS